MQKTAIDKIHARKAPIQTRSIARVEQILRAAETLLREQGLAAVTTSSIARKAGLPVGSIYQYFPNKKAVFFSLYDAYLQQIRTLMDVLDQDSYLEMSWVEFFTELFFAVKNLERRDTSELELFKAIWLCPELQAIDQQHGQETVNFMVKHLQRLGARGSRNMLSRLGWFIYELNNASWLYEMREDTGSHRKDSIEWERLAIMSVLGSVFPDDPPQS